MNPFEERIDATIKTTSKYQLQVPIRLITKSRVKKIKDIFNGLIQSI
jgi:hypothetical protein